MSRNGRETADAGVRSRYHCAEGLRQESGRKLTRDGAEADFPVDALAACRVGI
jgi:hypothetical protein